MDYDQERALKRFGEFGQSYDGFLSHHDIAYILQLDEVGSARIDKVDLVISSMERRQWELLSRFDSFRSHLLVERKMLLVNVRGQGYRIARPSEHAEIAARNFALRLRKAEHEAMQALHNVNTSMLTSVEYSRHIDVTARLSSIHSHIKRKLPDPKKYKRRR